MFSVGLVEKHHEQNPHQLILHNDDSDEDGTAATDNNNNGQGTEMGTQMAELHKEVMGAVKLMGELYKEMTVLKAEMKELKSTNRKAVKSWMNL